MFLLVLQKFDAASVCYCCKVDANLLASYDVPAAAPASPLIHRIITVVAAVAAAALASKTLADNLAGAAVVFSLEFIVEFFIMLLKFSYFL